MPDPLHRTAGEDVAGEELGQLRRHRLVVGHARLRHVQRGHPGDVRLELLDLAGGEPAEPDEAVLGAPPEQLLHRRDLRDRGGDDDLAGPPERELVLLAEPGHAALAVDAQAGLERARPVVETGVDDAAVVSRLVGAHLGLLLEHGDRRPRHPLGHRGGGGESHDPSADHAHVVHGLSSALDSYTRPREVPG